MVAVRRRALLALSLGLPGALILHAVLKGTAPGPSDIGKTMARYATEVVR